MKISSTSGREFTPHPETDALVKAVIVDITELKKRQTIYGEKEEFRIVFETEVLDGNGNNCYIWSRGYTPNLNEKANFRKDLKQIYGRDLTAQEQDDFETENLIGVGLKLMVRHAIIGEKTYANISIMLPDKEPLISSGKFAREKDRETRNDDGGGEKSSYKKTPVVEGRVDWQKVKVHVGKHAGVDLGDLEEEAVQSLIDKWLILAFPAMAKPLKADLNLAAALEEVKALLAGESSEDSVKPQPETDY